MTHVAQESAHLQEIEDVLPVEDIDYFEVFTGNAKQAVFYYSKLFGLDIIGYSGLETGRRDRVSYVLARGDVRFVISGSYAEDSPITRFVSKHGEGIQDIALRVSDVEQAYRMAVQNGGIPVVEPHEEADEHGVIKKAVIGTFGDTVHTLIERTNYHGTFLPGFQPVEEKSQSRDTKLVCFDHIAVNVESVDEWTQYYGNVFGFKMLNEFSPEDISSENSALMTKAMQNGTKRVRMTIVSPAPGKKKSQLQEFMEYNQGPGVHHVAMLTHDILEAVENLQANGIKFLYTPDAYYEMLPERVGEIDESLDELNRLNILVDRDEDGYLLQIFAQPMHDRPTMFYEIIQRKGSGGFGNNNIRALFEAAEREQAKRGNL